MILGSPAFSGAVRIGAIAGCVLGLASCSTVTYGTGTPTTAQTIQDLTRILNFRGNDPINYQARPDLQTPAANTLLPPTGAGVVPGEDGNLAAPPVNLTQQQLTNCALAQGQLTPPPEYCTPNPNAPAMVVQNNGLLGGGLLGGGDGAGVRDPIDPCQWWQLAWQEINSDEQEIWGRLGWDASNWGSVNSAIWPESAGKSWSDLRLRERRAASSLGFDEVNWNACLV